MFKQQKLSAFLFLIALALSFIFTQSVQAGSIFNRDLQVGNVNFDVQALQKFLNTHGFALAKYGSGSLGRETTYFGTATKNALTKFQQANQIVPATGYLNLTTRNLVNKMLASVVINHSLTGGTVINTKTNSQAPTPIATSTSNQLHSYYSIGGSVYGIDGAITIKNNGGDNVIVTPRDNSEFIFSTKLAAGANYDVTVQANSISQHCYIKNATGTVPEANVSDIKIACGENLYYNPFTFIPSGGGVNISSGGGVSSYALTYAAGSGGSLTGATAQTISRGNSGTAVTAVASTGYHFVNWSDNSTANPRTDANVTGNITVSANFARNPAPTITSISLNSGPVAGGTSLTITGANFSNLGGSPDVSFGGNLVLATYVSTSSLTVVTPAGVAGTVDVTVSNPDGQSATKVNGFTYISAPAAIAVTSGNSQITTINSMFVSPLAVVVTDALGNPVSGVSVTFTAPNSGASGIFADSRTTTTMAITNASGVATSPALTANGIAGSYQIIATSGALVTHFNLTNQDAI